VRVRDEADQLLATARNRQVDEIAQLQQFEHRFAAEILDQRDGCFRKFAPTQGTAQRLGDCAIAVDRFRAAAQQRDVAGHETQCCGIRGDVRPRLVDHRDETQRNAHTFDDQSVGPHFGPRDRAHRIRQIPDGPDACGHSLQPPCIEAQSIDQRLRLPGSTRRVDVELIGRKNRSGLRIERSRHCSQRIALVGGRQCGNPDAGSARCQREFTHGRGCGHCVAISASATRSSRRTIESP